MKIIPKRKWKHLCFLLLGLFAFANISAQTSKNTITGKVIDEAGAPLVGVSVAEKGTTTGSMTNLDGVFTLNVNKGATLTVSYLGFQDQEVKVGTQTNYVITLKEDKQLLEEVVVIGYGSVKKKDLTGSISAIGEKDFSKGVTTSPAQLLTGKVPGVQITSNGGRPGAGSRIRIRGGASLNASNDPLIVIDGVPIDQEGKLSGSTDPLTMINPNDIESMNILKDASATAIYGSRASNGVILITTKKAKLGGTKGVRVNFNSNNSIAYNSNKVDLLSANEYRQLLNSVATPTQILMMGDANTDWQDEIYRTAFTTENNLSLSGAAGILPYYISASFTNNNGILKTDNMKRTTLSVNLSPTFLDNHLSVNVNVKGTLAHARFGNNDAIGAALRMDPTQPVKAEGYEIFNGYWNWLADPQDVSKGPSSLATKNPVAQLESRKDVGDTYRSIGNIQLDYKMHFLPELRANINLGYDIAKGKGKNVIAPWGPQRYTEGGINDETGLFNVGGFRSKYDQTRHNVLFEGYLNYNKTFDEIHSQIDVMAGHSYQDWKTTDNSYPETTYDGARVLKRPIFDHTYKQNTLLSYFARLNYTLFDRYMLTASVRRDGSSRFSKENRWGTFPSAALAWRISDESFMKNFTNLYNLKLRMGVGQTGQNEIDNYGYIPSFSPSYSGGFYQIGDKFYSVWRPDGFDANRKWESTTTYNVALDYGLFGNRVSGSVDLYLKKTKDLLNTVPLAIGENNTNEITKNIGSMENKGVEFNVTFVPIDSKNLTWDFGFNATYNESKITKLTVNDGDPRNDYILLVGDISGGTGRKVQRHAVGYAPNTFFLHKQLYDANGRPIDGGYADLDGDNTIDDIKDRYLGKRPEPKWFLGFNTSLRYTEWTMSTSLRANLGNYAYNNIYSDAGNYKQVLQSGFMQNAPRDILTSQFSQQQVLSDYYLQNASFLKMDYLSLAYDFKKFLTKTKGIGFTASFTVQNVFTATKYSGVDPEIAGGIDRNFYPNPRTFILGLNLNF